MRPNLKLVIGVPTVGREKDIYLYDTLDSVFKGIEIYKNKSANEVGVLIFVGGANEDFFEQLAEKFKEKYASTFNC